MDDVEPGVLTELAQPVVDVDVEDAPGGLVLQDRLLERLVRKCALDPSARDRIPKPAYAADLPELRPKPDPIVVRDGVAPPPSASGLCEESAVFDREIGAFRRRAKREKGKNEE